MQSWKGNLHLKERASPKGNRAGLLTLHLPHRFHSPTHEFEQDDATLIVSTLKYFFFVLHIKWQGGLPDNLQQRQKLGKQKRLAFVFLALHVVHIFSSTY